LLGVQAKFATGNLKEERKIVLLDKPTTSDHERISFQAAVKK
jgi:hypothetical protein